MNKVIIWVLLLTPLTGCAYSQKGIHETPYTIYIAQGQDPLVSRFAPVFLPYNYQASYNRIGRPSAKYDDQGQEQVFVDPRSPVIYYMSQGFSTEKGTYLNLVYRVHFPEIPFSLVPFNLSAGKNPGLIVVVTLGEEEQPLLVTSVGSCGCYAAIVPTSYLPREAFPEKWRNEPLKVFGETLPSFLDYGTVKDPKLVVYLRSEVHRVMALEVVEGARLQDRQRFIVIRTPMEPMDGLERIPINGKTTSFYYQGGAARGHVKGALKLWETLFLGIPSLDFFVGTDKAYGDSHTTDNTFYTSLKPWNQRASDMRDFARFLRFWGWRL